MHGKRHNLQSLTHQSPRRGSDRLTGQSPATPEELTHNGFDGKGHTSTSRFHAKQCNPHSTDGRHGMWGDHPTSMCSSSGTQPPS